MKSHYPVTIVSDRYHGTYSDAEWLAFPLDRDEVPEEVGDGDMEEMYFWDHYDEPVGKGATPDAAFNDLIQKMAALSAK